MSPAVPHDQQAIEQTKRDCRHDEQIHRRDAAGMIMKERLPPLRWRASSPGQILSRGGLADFDAELEQLAMNSGRFPQRIGDAHLADQPARCQRTMVSGFTIANPSQTLG